MTNNCTFTPDTLTMNGTTYPAGYSVTPSGTVFAFVPVVVDGEARKLRIKITRDDPRHAAALAAAKGQTAQEAQPAEVEPEQAQADPKKTRGPVPDKLFVGMEIKGNGWKIVFDGGYDRTRVIFKRKPSNAAREALNKYGFFWSPTMKSWNKKLTHKAFRAAQALALELREIAA